MARVGYLELDDDEEVDRRRYQVALCGWIRNAFLVGKGSILNWLEGKESFTCGDCRRAVWELDARGCTTNTTSACAPPRPPAKHEEAAALLRQAPPSPLAWDPAGGQAASGDKMTGTQRTSGAA